MTVKVTKPAVNLREELADLRKPSGIAGEAMLRADTPQEQFNLISAGRRNLLINGGFDVWQRGTSSSATLTNDYATADRWNFNTRSCTTKNISQEDFTAGQTEVEGNPTYFLRSEFSNDSGSTGPFIMQRIEDVTKTSGQFVTASFYAKASSGGGPVEFSYSQQFGSGGSTAVSVPIETFTPTSSWKKYTFTYQIPSISGKTIGTGNYLRFDFQLPANTAITFDVAQVQLELGKVATPFDHPRSYGEELALCQRYYYRVSPDEANYLLGTSYVLTSTVAKVMVEFPVLMRTSPTGIEQSGTAGDYKVNIGGSTSTCSAVPTYNDSSKKLAQVNFIFASGLTSGQAGVAFSTDTDGYIGFTGAEL